MIFYRKGDAAAGSTQAAWVFDLRANMPTFGKTTPVADAHFTELEAAYGGDPNGLAPRTDPGA